MTMPSGVELKSTKLASAREACYKRNMVKASVKNETIAAAESFLNTGLTKVENSKIITFFPAYFVSNFVFILCNFGRFWL